MKKERATRTRRNQEPEPPANRSDDREWSPEGAERGHEAPGFEGHRNDLADDEIHPVPM